MPRMKQISIDVDVDKAIYANRLAHSESENDILRRMLLSPAAPKLQKVVVPITHPRELKRRGKWSVQLIGEEHSAANMKDAYCTILRLLADLDAQFLPRFSMYKSSSRRFIAKEAKSLYMKSPHLAEDFASKLVDGWFVDTNVSEQQVAKRVRAAAEVSSLRYGVDLYIANEGEAI